MRDIAGGNRQGKYSISRDVATACCMDAIQERDNVSVSYRHYCIVGLDNDTALQEMYFG